MEDGFKFARAFHPAPRTVARREHQQASQASGASRLHGPCHRARDLKRACIKQLPETRLAQRLNPRSQFDLTHRGFDFF